MVLAGGGSGGHIAPGLAIAEHLVEDPGGEIIFVCSRRAIDRRMLDRAGARRVAIPARPPSLHPLRGVGFLRAFRASRRQCETLLRQEHVDGVVALGGFVAAPVVAAAVRTRVPVVLLNLDRPPGRANRWMAPRCAEVWSAVPLPEQPGFAARITGMPVRRAAVAPGPRGRRESRTICRRALGLDPDRLTLLVTGASQGAQSLNRFMISFARREPELFAGWQVHHLAGPGAAEPTAEDYRSAGVQALLEPFREEIGLAWGAADLALSRAGANSVAEAQLNAVPALFLPYPHHRDRHQHMNALPLVERGGAVIADDRIDPDRNARNVGPVLATLMRDGARRKAMRERLLADTPADAGAGIAALLRERFRAAARRGIQ